MQMSKNNRAVVIKSKKWLVFVAMLKLIAEYTGDYLSGNKHKFVRLNQEKQNTK